MKKIGLTLGKYAPLHKGHQFVIETALKEVDELFIIIYDFKGINISLEKRAEWIETLYPEVKIIKAYNPPSFTMPKEEAGKPIKNFINKLKIKLFLRMYEKSEEKFIKKLLNGQNITHFYCSEYYGEHVSKALSAADRRVDEKREDIPICASKIRENPYRYREFLDAVVYKDFVKKIVFMGAPSTGKTTLAQELARRHNTAFMPEYGREYWQQNQKNRRIDIEELDIIAQEHIKREDILIKEADKYFFVDTNAITTYMFALDYHNRALPLLEDLAKKAENRYDLYFVCGDDIPYDDTWDRSGDVKRKNFQKQIISDLKKRGINYILLKGSLEERIKTVERYL